MPDQPEPACLVIADISGYTSYLAGVELDHAQDILADLTDAVVRALRPTFRLAKLEGDAAFAYVVTDVIDGSILQDTIEHCYIAFRRRLATARAFFVAELPQPRGWQQHPAAAHPRLRAGRCAASASAASASSAAPG